MPGTAKPPSLPVLKLSTLKHKPQPESRCPFQTPPRHSLKAGKTIVQSHVPRSDTLEDRSAHNLTKRELPRNLHPDPRKRITLFSVRPRDDSAFSVFGVGIQLPQEPSEFSLTGPTLYFML